MINQKEFFDLVSSRFKNKTEAQRVIADQINVTTETVKKWMYNNVSLTLERFREIVRCFDITPEELFRHQQHFVNFGYADLTRGDMESYVAYIRQLADLIERVVDTPGAKIIFRADDIPLFHLMAYPELTAFKLYCYAHDILGYRGCYEEFVEELPLHELQPLFDRIAHAYAQVYSIEVWDDHILDTLLYYLKYVQDMKLFRDKASPAVILQELGALVDGLERCARKGTKEGGAKFEFLRMDFPIRLGSMLVDLNNHLSFVIKLDTIGSITTVSSPLAQHAEKSFRASIDKSRSLGIGSKRDRTVYFGKLRDQILLTEQTLS